MKEPALQSSDQAHNAPPNVPKHHKSNSGTLAHQLFEIGRADWAAAGNNQGHRIRLALTRKLTAWRN